MIDRTERAYRTEHFEHVPPTQRRDPEPTPTTERTLSALAGGATVEALGGLAAVVLVVIALADILPFTLTAVASLCIGAALLAEGAAIAGRWSHLINLTGADRNARSELGGGVSAELLGGLCVITLGVLALVGVAPTVVLPVAVLVGGAALLIGTSAVSRLSMLRILPGVAPERGLNMGREQVSAAAGLQAIVGIAAITLGILALIGFAPAILTMVGLLCLGVSEMISGGAVTTKVQYLLGKY